MIATPKSPIRARVAPNKNKLGNKKKARNMSTTGYIQLHRKILDWEWWDDIKTSRLFLTMLLMANHKDKKWRGIVVPKGSFISSIEGLSKTSGLSQQSVRTALHKLKSTSEVTSESTNQYTQFTLVNWGTHQCELTSKSTNEQQTNNKRTTTTNNVNNDNKSFIAFWNAYPQTRKIAKKKCLEIWKRKRLDGRSEEVLAGLDKLKSSCSKWKEGFNPSTTTFLNQERWNDEPEVKDTGW